MKAGPYQVADQDTQIRALAAMTGTQGQMPETPAEKDVLILGMVATALGKHISWAQIGTALGWGSGREAKRTAHALRRGTEARLRREAVDAELARYAGHG